MNSDHADTYINTAAWSREQKDQMMDALDASPKVQEVEETFDRTNIAVQFEEEMQ